MRIVLGGQLENSYLKSLTEQYDENRYIGRAHGYYGSLFRYTDKSFFDRAGTLASIADQVILSPALDWALGANDSVVRPDFGLITPDDREWQKLPTYELAKLAIEQSAFSSKSRTILEAGGSERVPVSPSTQAEKIEFATLQLAQMINQIVVADGSNAFLALSGEDQEILAELADFVEESKLELPFYLPAIRSMSIIHDETIPSALIDLSPVDAATIRAVRKDKLIKNYSRKVSEAFTEKGGFEKKKLLVEAMRQAAGEEGRLHAASSILEVISSVVGALHIPGASLLLKGVTAKLKSERLKGSWHLISVRMSEVKVRDYLNRNDNL